MADGSPQTIDRIQVEFSTNLKDLISNLDTADQSLKTTVQSIDTAEASSKKYSNTTGSMTTVLGKAQKSSAAYTTSLKSSSTAAVAASTSMGGYTAATMSAGTAVAGASTAVAAYTGSVSNSAAATTIATAAVGEYTIAATTQTAAAGTAAAAMKANASASVGALAAVKEAFTPLKPLLGMFGVSVGIGALIGQLKELAKEAGNAGKAYGQMYNTIYYTIGELTDSQKELANTLGLEFDKTKVAETVSRVSVLFPSAETTQLEDGQSALESISRELLWLDAKGISDVSTTITSMNEAFKKWKISTDDVTLALSYLRATYQDTQTDMITQLNYLTKLDEVGTTLNMTFEEMADFIGAANVAGNLEDLSNVGMRFEAQYASRVSGIYNALLSSDRETLLAAGVPADQVDTLIQAISEGLTVDETAAKTAAQDLASTIVTAIFRAAHEEAASAATQAQASQIWADALGIEVSRITNRLADLSMSATRGASEDTRTSSRDKVKETGQTTTLLVTKEKGLGVSDYTRQNEAYWENELRNSRASKWTPTVEENVWQYNNADYPAMISRALGTLTAIGEIYPETKLTLATINPALGAAGLTIDNMLKQPLNDTEESQSTSMLEDLAEQILSVLENIFVSGPASPTEDTEPATYLDELEPIDYTTPLDDISASVSGMKTSIDTLNSGLSGMRPEVTVNQYIYAPTADSYVIRNAAAMAINTSQAESYRLRA